MKIIKVLVSIVLTIIFLATVGALFTGWLLMLLFGIVHLHISGSVPAIGYWVGVPLGALFNILKLTSTGTTKKSE